MRGDLFDDDRLDWNKENVIEEDYSFAVHDSKLTTNGRTYEFCSPYSSLSILLSIFFISVISK